MHPDYVEIHITWNPNFKYGGNLSIEEYRMKEGELIFTHNRNGIWSRHEAWQICHDLTRDKKHFLILDDTLNAIAVAD